MIAQSVGLSYPLCILTMRRISQGRDRSLEESTHHIPTQSDITLLQLVRLGICVVRRLGQHRERLPILSGPLIFAACRGILPPPRCALSRNGWDTSLGVVVFAV